MAYFCPYCGNYTGGKFNPHLRHIKYHHSQEPNFSITCEDCGQKCDTVEELTRFLALFILKMKETNGLSQQALDNN